MLLYYIILTLALITGILLIRRKAVVKTLTVAFLIVQTGLFISLFYEARELMLGYFIFDPLAKIFLGLLSILSITTAIHGFNNLKTDSTRRYQNYHAAFCGLVASITLATLADNLTVVWVFIEATTLLVSVLIYHEKNKLTLEAVWKYIFVCSTGIAIAYMGILFLGLAMTEGTGFDLGFEGMSRLLVSSNPLYLKIAFLFVLLGYSSKMELFPMHTAGVDANSVAQPQIAAFMSTAMVNLGFVAFFRIYKMLAITEIKPWMDHILILTGLLSILVAAGYMLKARHTKRMLAYSTLEIMGIVAIAIGIGGYGLHAAILLLVVHSLTKSGIFYQLSQMFRIFHTYKLKEVGDYFHHNPLGSMVLLVGLAGILAIPPSGLFRPEFMVFSQLASGNYWIVLGLMFFLMSFLVYGMATRMLHVLFSPRLEVFQPLTPVKANITEIFVQMSLLLMAMSLCFYEPVFLETLIDQAIQLK